MDILPLYIYWILGGNASSHSNDKYDVQRFWKTFSSPIDYRKPIETENTHDMRRPVEIVPDFNLRRPAFPEESHDLRWPIVEEDSHDLRNPILEGDSQLGLRELSDPDPEDHGELGEDLEASDSNFWRHDEVNVDRILSNEDILNLCVHEFSATSYDPSSGYGKTRVEAAKVCGKTYAKSVPRLVGGKNSNYLQWPWMVSVRQLYRGEYRHKCGAALVNSWWVVTAAHCVNWQPKWSLLLRLGSHNLNKDSETYPSVDRSVQKVVIHAEFDPITFENDLALLMMVSPVDFRPNVSPVCLPENVGDLVGKMGVVLGWGRVTDRGLLSGTLQELHLPVLSNQECEEMYEKTEAKEKILDTFLCAGTAEGGADACDGDSGGPMSVVNKDGRWSLVGIVSWGKVCAAPNQPGVYTRITEYIQWLEGNMACNSG